MRIHTECMSFRNPGKISTSYDIQPDQQCSQWRCCVSQAALQKFEVLLGVLPALPVSLSTLPRLMLSLSCAPLVSTGPSGPCRVVASASRSTWRPLHWSSQLWDLITLGLWSDNSQTLPEASSDIFTFCWWSPEDYIANNYHKVLWHD